MGKDKEKRQRSKSVKEDVQAYYGRKPELDRLSKGGGKLEFLRTKEIIGRYLPPPPGRVLEIGGGTGHYSFWLAGLGHRVTLVDLAERHIALVREKNERSAAKLEAVVQGDILDLPFPPGSFDAVLNLGPMYHLQEREERIAALRHIRRVLAPGGLAFSAYISRFASLIDGYWHGFIRDPRFEKLVAGDLETGKHNPDADHYFTQAYLHRPEEIAPELEKAGFSKNRLLPVEGVFWLSPELTAVLKKETETARLLEYARRLENEPSLIGASSHLLAVSRK